MNKPDLLKVYYQTVNSTRLEKLLVIEIGSEFNFIERRKPSQKFLKILSLKSFGNSWSTS